MQHKQQKWLRTVNQFLSLMISMYGILQPVTKSPDPLLPLRLHAGYSPSAIAAVVNANEGLQAKRDLLAWLVHHPRSPYCPRTNTAKYYESPSQTHHQSSPPVLDSFFAAPCAKREGTAPSAHTRGLHVAAHSRLRGDGALPNRTPNRKGAREMAEQTRRSVTCAPDP